MRNRVRAKGASRPRHDCAKLPASGPLNPRTGRARYRDLRSGTAFAALFALGLTGFTPAAQAGDAALPTGGAVTHGAAAITGSGNGLLINQTTGSAIISWETFSVGTGATTHFNNGSGATLNRVAGNVASTIDGSLTATGSLFLVNPAGVTVGTGGMIATGGSFIASTHDVSDADFLNGGDTVFAGDSKAGIVNHGIISSAMGDVALIARRVENTGDITAANGTAALLAGYDVLMHETAGVNGRFAVRIGGADTEAINSGTINAAEAELRANGGNVLALAGNTKGVVKASGVARSGGRIFLTAGGGKVQATGRVTARRRVSSGSAGQSGGNVFINADTVLASANIDVSGLGAEGGSIDIGGRDVTLRSATLDASGASGGGRIRIGGAFQGGDFGESTTADNTTVDENTLLTANAIVDGDGGEVVVWANGTTLFDGTIEVKGGAAGGGGGTAETSGKERLWVGQNAYVDALAPNGAVGDWLLDPKSITVATGGAATLPQAADSGETTTDLTIDPATINAAAANVTLWAAETVTFSNAVSMTNVGVGLTARAGDQITVNAGIATNNGDVTFLSDNYAINAAVNAGTGTIMFDRVTVGDFGLGFGVSLDTTELGRLTAGALVIGNRDAAQNRLRQLDVQNTFNLAGNITGLVQLNALSSANAFVTSSGDQTFHSLEYNAADGVTYVGSQILTTTVGDAVFNVDADAISSGSSFDDLRAQDGPVTITSAEDISVVTQLLSETDGSDADDDTGSFILKAAGDISVTRSTSGTVGVGDGASGGLRISDAQLGRMTANSLTFGDTANTTAMDVGDVALAGIGTLNLNAQGDITLGALNNAGGTIHVNTSAGSILDGNDPANGALNITAGSLSLRAATGIGGAGAAAAIETQVSNLEAQTQTGGIFIANTGDLTIGGVIGAISGLRATAGGDIEIAAAGSINVNMSGESILGTGAVTLTASGASSDILTGTNAMDPQASVASSGGTVRLAAGRDILLGDPAGAGTLGNVYGGGSVELEAGRDISVDTGTFVYARGAGTVTAAAGRDISVIDTSGAFNGAEIRTDGGDISLTAGAGGSLTIDNMSSPAIQTTLNGGDGDITLNADNMVIQNTIRAGTGTVTLAPVTAGQLIDIGGGDAAGTLGLTNAEIDRITAGTLHIGSADAGAVAAGTIALSKFGTIEVETGGNANFNGTVNGAFNLAVFSPGLTTFGDAVGGITPLASLTTDAGGSTIVNGGLIATTGSQTYGDDLQVAADTTLTSSGGDIALDDAVDGAFDLAVNTSGDTTFAGKVGGVTPLASLTTDAGGSTFVNGGLIATTGSQTYGDEVNVAGTVFAATGGDSDLIYNAGIATAFPDSDIWLLAGRNIVFGGDMQWDGAGDITLVSGWDGTTGWNPGDTVADRNAIIADTDAYGEGGDVFIGDGTQATSVEVGSRLGDVYVLAHDLEVLGSAVSDFGSARLGYETAGIAGIDSDISIWVRDDVFVLGGSTDEAYAQIGHVNVEGDGAVEGDITIFGDTPDLNEIVVEGGDGARAYAQIGHTQRFGNSTGAISIRGENVHVHGGFADGAFGQIGHAADILAGGAIDILASNELDVLGGTDDDTFAQIGHFSDQTASGETKVQAMNDLAVLGGDSLGSYAQIGHIGNTADGLVDVDAGGFAILAGGFDAGSATQIGHHSGALSSSDILFDVGGSLILTAFVSDARSYVGHSGAGDATGNIGVKVGGSLIMGTLGDAASAQIGHIADAGNNGDIAVAAGDTIFLGNLTDGSQTRIGHGDAMSTGALSGDIDVTAGGPIALHGALFGAGFSQIGHGDPFGFSTGTRQGDISVAAAGQMTLDDGFLGNSLAWIGHGTGTAGGVSNADVYLQALGFDRELLATVPAGGLGRFNKDIIEADIVGGDFTLVATGAGLLVEDPVYNSPHTVTMWVNNDLVLDANAVFVNSGAGDIILAAGGDFHNDTGSMTPLTTGGRWLVYSTRPDDNRNDIEITNWDFLRYATTFDINNPLIGSGDGLIYSVAPVVHFDVADETIIHGQTPSPTVTQFLTVNGLTVDALAFGLGINPATAQTALAPFVTVDGSGNAIAGFYAGGLVTTNEMLPYFGMAFATAPGDLTVVEGSTGVPGSNPPPTTISMGLGEMCAFRSDDEDPGEEGENYDRIIELCGIIESGRDL